MVSKLVEQRSERGNSRKTTQLVNEPPIFSVLSEKALTDEEALAGLEEFVATSSNGGPFAPRDDIVVRLQMMQKAMIRDQALPRRQKKHERNEVEERTELEKSGQKKDKKKKKRKKSE